MKVGILIDALIPGGVQKTAIEEVRHLRRSGHEATLVVIRRGRYIYRYEDILGDVPVLCLFDELPRPLRVSFPFPFFHFFSTHHLTAPMFAPMVLQEKFDVVVSHATTTCLMAQQMWRRRKVPYLAFIWDPMIYVLGAAYSETGLRFLYPALFPWASRVERSFLDDALGVITCSNVHLKALKEVYDVESRVVYPGCNPTKKVPRRRGDHVLSFTRWDRAKRPEFLLEIAKKLPKAEFLVAGAWTRLRDQKEFMKKVSDLKMEERMRLAPKLTKSDIPRLCAEARVWIHPIFEAFGMGALEAATQACPMIMPRGSGATELFTHGVHGFFPNQGDADAYAKYIGGLMSDERLAWKMGHEAWKTARKYTWEFHTQRLVEVMESLDIT